METVDTKRTPAETLARKNQIGVTYRALAELVTCSHETIRVVLLEKESGLEIDRDRILTETNAALDQLEAEQAT